GRRLCVPRGDVGVEVRIPVEQPPEDREVVTAVREVTGDERRPRMLPNGALERVDHALMVDDAGLIVEAPIRGVDEAVVRRVHRLIHPHRLRDVDANRHPEISAPLEQRVHPRVVDMHAERLRIAVYEPLALVAELADADGTGLEAPLELRHRGWSVARLVVAG